MNSYLKIGQKITRQQVIAGKKKKYCLVEGKQKIRKTTIFDLPCAYEN
jgi:hypothetical protein